MRASSTVVLAAGVVAGLVTLPPRADAATRHPAPRPVHGRHAAPRPWTEDQIDPWPGSMADIARRFAPSLDEPEPGDEESGPDLPVPGARPIGDRPVRHHRRKRHHVPLPPRRERYSSIGDRVPGDRWPFPGVVSVCVDVNVVTIVHVIVRVGCDCAPPPPPVKPPPPRPIPRPTPRPAPPRKARPVVAVHPRPPAPPVPSKTPSVAPRAHRALTPRAAVPPRRKEPLATLMVLVVLTVVIAAGAGVAFAR